MNLNELREKIESAIPGASIDQDNDGQIVIYTGLKLAEDYSVVPVSDKNE